MGSAVVVARVLPVFVLLGSFGSCPCASVFAPILRFLGGLVHL